VSSRCTSYRRYRLIAAALAVLSLLLFAHPGPARAADKSRKPESKRERPAKDKSASNKSVRTQQRAADAFAEETGKSKKSKDDEPAETADSLRAQLASVEDRIKKEDERHESAVAALSDAGSDKQSAKARKAAEKEESTHRRNRAALDAERAAVLAKLDSLKGKSSDKPPADDRSTPAAARTR
jgi:hypothetical protein